MRSHFGQKATELRERIEVASTLPKEPDPKKFAKKGMDTDFIHSGFVQIVPKKGTDAKKLATELNRKDPVWSAVVAPRPVPAMPAGAETGSRLFRARAGLSRLGAGRGRRDGCVEPCRSEGQRRHHLRHRGQLEPEP